MIAAIHGAAATATIVGITVGGAALMGHRGHPRRDVTVMYLTWTVATFAIAGYGIATAAWQLMAACLVFNALEAAGTIVWATIKQRHVPASMLGRGEPDTPTRGASTSSTARRLLGSVPSSSPPRDGRLRPLASVGGRCASGLCR